MSPVIFQSNIMSSSYNKTVGWTGILLLSFACLFGVKNNKKDEKVIDNKRYYLPSSWLRNGKRITYFIVKLVIL